MYYGIVMMDYGIVMMEVMGSHRCIHLQTHQVVYIKYVKLFVCQSYLSKVV